MTAGLRWSPEQLEEFQRRRARHTGATPQAPTEKPRTKRPGAKKGPSELEHLFAKQLSDLKFAPPLREYEFMPNRGFRLDYAWPDRKIAVEVNGMVHRIKERFLRDTEKLAFAQIHGWRVLGLSGDDVRSGRGLSWLVSLWGNEP